MEENEYSGLRVYLRVEFDKIKEIIKLDISTGDKITPKEINYEYITLIENKKIKIFTYNIETVFAEKLETVLSRGIINSRMRDYYDCAILYDLFKDKIDFKILRKAFYKTIEARETTYLLKNYKEIIADIENNDSLKDFWKRYVENNVYVRGYSYKKTVDNLKKIIEKIIED